MAWLGAQRPYGRHRRAGRPLLAAALAILSGVLGALVLYQTSLQPGAALVAWVFNRDQLVTPPPGFSSITWGPGDRI